MPLLPFAILSQIVRLPDGTLLDFSADPLDSGVVDLRVTMLDGTRHDLTFTRNGNLLSMDSALRPAPAPDPVVDPSPENPLAGYKSVDDDAVRGEPDKA